MFEPTKAQSAAIDSKENTLVSAAAGSGKTAVLVQRVLKAFCNTEKPLMADRVLIVTFTNAAAAELKLRIEKELGKALDSDPYNTLLQKQKILLGNAKICTIDSFCINFIRDNFEKAGIDPSFKMADNADIRMLLSASVSKLLNDEFNSGNKEFLDLLNFVGSNYDDSELAARILNIFSYSRKMPFSNYWIEKIVRDYEDFANGESREWFKEGLEIFSENIEEAGRIIGMSAEALELNEAAYIKYNESIFYIKNFCERLLELSRKGDWNGIYSLIGGYAPPKLLSLPSAKKDANSDYAKLQRDNAKKLLESSFKLIYGSEEALREEIKSILPQLHKMAELVIKLGEIFYEEMKTRSLMTFDMAEQAALSLLAEYKNGEIVRKSGADEFICQFDEVLVDEYQDVNNLQDTLFNILSDDQKKLFCVGDAKQSIYRFRGANPFNFIKKKKVYREKEEADRKGLRIDLSGNFRSRAEICEYVNDLFGFIMHEDNAAIEYDDKERLDPLAKFPENSEVKVEKHFGDLSEIKESFDFGDFRGMDEKTVAEAHIIAKKILDTVAAKPFIKRDKTELRPANFSDIVILLRSLEAAPIISSVLKKFGIPVSISASNILESDEVVTLLSLLKAINNPFDDVGLLTLMTSRLYGFTIDELAKYRAKSRKSKLISALAMSKDEPKLSEFLSDLSYYRNKSITLKISGLIDEIFERTNFTGTVSRLADGEIKKSNLLSIRNFAASFEAEGKRSIREFLKALEGMGDKDLGGSSAGGTGVRIVTIHSSKGL
ncbi:MAG: UvrD-helicase domain-containing protein [Clostridia bacterium]|nr:UvrD-helicase domain-containing protein [Clostridia bacterium]